MRECIGERGSGFPNSGVSLREMLPFSLSPADASGVYDRHVDL